LWQAVVATRPDWTDEIETLGTHRVGKTTYVGYFDAALDVMYISVHYWRAQARTNRREADCASLANTDISGVHMCAHSEVLNGSGKQERAPSVDLGPVMQATTSAFQQMCSRQNLRLCTD
jgi:hypothetical protein